MESAWGNGVQSTAAGWNHQGMVARVAGSGIVRAYGELPATVRPVQS